MHTDIKHLNEQVFRYRNLWENAQDDIAKLSKQIQELEQSLLYYRSEQDGYLDAINKADEVILYAQEQTEPGDYICSTCQAVNDEINEYLNS